MGNKIKVKVLDALLDLYENSKTFTGDNVNEQRFKIQTSKLFPKYDDDSEYAFYKEVNTDLEFLKTKGFISYKSEKSGKIKNVMLNTNDDSLSAIYAYLHRTSRKETQSDLLHLLDSYTDSSDVNSPLQRFITEQKIRISKNKNVEHFDKETQDFIKFEDILKATRAVLQNEDETFIRDFSIKVFNDSKRFENLQSQVRSILTQYGDYDDKETVLSEYGIVKTPTYVCVKGNARITLGVQEINLSGLQGDIAFSTQTLKEITNISVFGSRIITIENLTSFHNYKNQNDLVIYLGGFHNTVKRDFICMMYKQNPNKVFLHFGDIDVGGFYILNHLKKRTDIPFKPLNMDKTILQKYKAQTKQLTSEDEKRINKMLGQNDFAEYAETLNYMITHDCKLEQEVVKE